VTNTTLIPEVGVKIHFPEEWDIGIWNVCCYMTLCLWQMLAELDCHKLQTDR